MIQRQSRIPLARIPLARIEDLDPQQAKEFENSPGGKLNLSLLLGHAKTIYPGFHAMSRAVFAQLTLPPLEREIVVLATLHLDRGEYEWAQHVQIARDMGIAQEKIDAIADHRFGAPVFDDREKALLAFARQVVKSVRVDDYVFGAVRAFYDPRQIVEAIYVIGLYMMILRVSEVAELPVDAVHGAAIVRDAVARQRAESGSRP
jgi:alkylhydroperoxidase family enzyme